MELNKEQEKAANHIEGPLLVLAGAGSGKTRVVTYRIANLLKLGILPSDILAVTFTNKAAAEMKKRVEDLTSSSVLTCTFHSLGARILRESISNLNFSQDFVIYDTDDSLRLIKTCLESLHVKNEKGITKKLKAMISSAKNDLIDPKDISSASCDTKEEKLFKDLYPIYQTKLCEYNALDFDDLLYLTVKLLKEKKDIRDEYQNRWLFILIDEYQDTNIAQYTLARLLVEKHKNIFVVGDPDQSIYAWRGAQYKNILRFDKDFPKAQIVHLEHNYRSTTTILEASNALINYNKERYDKKLWSNLGQGEKIGLFFANGETQEAQFIVEKLIDKHVNEKIPYEETVIFYRTNSQSRILEEALLSQQIPYVIYGGISFYQRKEIKDLLSFLRMIQSDADFISFSRTINLPIRGIGTSTVQKLLKTSETKQLPIFVFCKELINNPNLFPEIKIFSKQKNGLQGYIHLIEELRKLHSSGASICDIIKQAITKSKYLEHLQNDPETFSEKKENINELIAKAADWEERKETSNLFTFLEELSLLTNTEEKNTQHSVKLMTLHNGKGLEFSLVFLAGLEEDLLPHVNSKGSHEQIEEERRLCYVGMTRAKSHLFLSSCNARYLWGSLRAMYPSRFLKEIPSKYLNYLSCGSQQTTLEIEPTNNDSFFPGSRVVHKTFGSGIVKKAYESSSGFTYDVYFETTNTTRSLVAKYAKLKSGSF
jgi:DNA helicase-2/ATP-dependent DNA helicase PcrA